MVGFCIGIQLHSEIRKFLSFSPAYGAFESLPVRQAGLSHRQFSIPFSYLLTEGWETYPQKYNGALACPCLPNTIKKGSQSLGQGFTKGRGKRSNSLLTFGYYLMLNLNLNLNLNLRFTKFHKVLHKVSRRDRLLAVSD
jgi:hypothetical protein